MVLTLMLVARKTMRLEDYITPRHIDAMCKLVILTSGMVGLAYGTEFFTALYSGNPYEQFAFMQPRARPARLGLLDHGGVQRADPAAALVHAACGAALLGGLRHLDLRSTSACGSSASSSSSRRCSATSCRRAGRRTRRRSIEIATLIGSFGLFFTASCSSAGSFRSSRSPKSRPSSGRIDPHEPRPAHQRRTRAKRTSSERRPPPARRGSSSRTCTRPTRSTAWIGRWV